jgi:arylsulfatase
VTAVCSWLSVASVTTGSVQQTAPARKPNIVVIFGDDIGVWSISAYHRGMMGGRTPNIDKLAQQGAMFTD